MVNKYLGKTIDIHSGGKDLIFPHHENEIAQSEAANDAPFAKYWLHNGHINVDNQKMSKSLGNFFTVRDVSEKYDYEVIRFFMLSAHYRSPINFSDELMEQAKTGLERIYTCLEHIKFLLDAGAPAGADAAFADEMAAFKQKFIDAMSDDLNTADAISVLFEMVRAVNKLENPQKGDLELSLSLFKELGGVLGLLNRKQEAAGGEVEALIEKRQQARADKNWALADEIRDQLKDMGITLKDTPQGVKWSRE